MLCRCFGVHFGHNSSRIDDALSTEAAATAAKQCAELSWMATCATSRIFGGTASATDEIIHRRNWLCGIDREESSGEVLSLVMKRELSAFQGIKSASHWISLYIVFSITWIRTHPPTLCARVNSAMSEELGREKECNISRPYPRCFSEYAKISPMLSA